LDVALERPVIVEATAHLWRRNAAVGVHHAQTRDPVRDEKRKIDFRGPHVHGQVSVHVQQTGNDEFARAIDPARPAQELGLRGRPYPRNSTSAD
jgi:hypothetical protein